MSCFKPDRGHYAGVERCLPGFNANTPAVAGLEAREAEFGAGSNQVVTDGGLVAQEFIGH